jgi:addiction module RelE/StbE family toxin
MSVKLEWSSFAIADREQIFDYIAADNLVAAISVDERISERIGQLMRFPESGRPGRVEGTRELIIVGTPYIAAYRFTRKAVRILRVLHGAQMWPDQLGD